MLSFMFMTAKNRCNRVTRWHFATLSVAVVGEEGVDGWVGLCASSPVHPANSDEAARRERALLYCATRWQGGEVRRRDSFITWRDLHVLFMERFKETNSG